MSRLIARVSVLCFIFITAIGTAAPLVPQSVVSRKFHGGVPREIQLPLTGVPGIECRDTGGSYQIVATFASTVTFSSASVDTGSASVSGSSATGSEITVDLTGVGNAQRIVVKLANVGDGTDANDILVQMDVLVGDTNGNGLVNSSDVSFVQAESGHALTNTNFRTDVTVNGAINSSDVSTVQSVSGTALPCPSALISEVSGDGQIGMADAFLPDPLVVQVLCGESYIPLSNMPVTFSVDPDYGGLSSTNGGTTAATITINTDSSGLAVVYLKTSANASSAPVVSASVTYQDTTNVTQFSEYAGFQPIPTINYAVLDISGTQASTNVYTIALGDDNKAAFSYLSDSNHLTVKTWVDGVVALKQIITPLHTTETYQASAQCAGPNPVTVNRTVTYEPDFLMSSGKVFGTARGLLSFPSGNAGVDLGFESSNGTVALLPSGHSFPTLVCDGQGVSLTAAIENGYGALATGAEFGVTQYQSAGLVSLGGTDHLFQGDPYSFQPLGMNDNGWTILGKFPVFDDATFAVWDTVNFLALPSFPYDINNGGQVVGPIRFSDEKGNQLAPDDLFFWHDGVATNLKDLLNTAQFRQWRSQIGEVNYYSDMIISNASPIDGSSTILFHASNQEDETGNNHADRIFLLKINANGAPIDLHILKLPDGVTLIYGDVVGMNANGIISAIGKPNASAATDHAMLLLPLQLTQVTFSATDESKCHPVVKDRDGHPFSEVHNNASQWRATDLAPSNPSLQGWQDPICFTATSTMTALLQIHALGNWPAGPDIKVRGTGTGTGQGYDFPETEATYNTSNHVITTSAPIVCSQPFQEKRRVDYINSLTISWQISVDGGSSWIPIGSSSNECFVTLSDPTPPKGDGQYKLYQTVLHYACSNAGATDDHTAVANTWSLFAGPSNITAWNPSTKTYQRSLHYYSKPFSVSPQPVSTTGLLREPDGFGECYSFAQLFQDALLANGISSTGIRITPENIEDSYFLVKNLAFTSVGSLVLQDPIYQWRMIFDHLPPEMERLPNPPQPNVYGDLTNSPGVPGQGITTPVEKVFGNHYVVEYDAIYYDPSYGIPHDGPEIAAKGAFEAASIAGYAKSVGFDPFSLKVTKPNGLGAVRFTPISIPHE
jgi:hypothetical protein